MIKVLADGRFLSRPISGIGRVTTELALRFLAAENISVTFHNSDKNLNPAYLNLHAFNVTRRPRSNDYSVYWGCAHRLPFLLPKHMKRLLTIHDLVWRLYPETMRFKTLLGEHIYFNRSVRSADHIVCISEETQTQLQRHMQMLTSISVIPHGGDFTSEKKTGGVFHTMSQGLNGLYVGSFEPRKNIARAIEGLMKANATLDTRIKLTLVGADTWDDNLWSLAKNCEYITMITEVDNRELHNLYQQADFLICPSIYEGFGLPIVEAAHHGIPLLLSRCNSHLEIAKGNAIYFDPLNVDSIASAFLSFANEPSPQAFKEKSKNIARQFTWEHAANKYIEIFKNLASQ